MKMDSSRLLAYIAVALDKLQYRRKQSNGRSDQMGLEIMIRGLRVVRTFLLCSTLLTEDNDFTLCSQKQKQDNSRMREDLGSILIGVEDVVRKILDDHIPYQPYDFRYDMESCDEEMDNWYTSLSDYLMEYSTSPTANQIMAIMDSVLENLKDYLISKTSYDFDLKEQLQQIEALKRNITVMRTIICLGTLLCTENQGFQYLLAISAAHLALHLFSNIKGPMHHPTDVKSSMLSALLLKFNHADYPLALASLKRSRESCYPNPTLDLNDHPFIIKMENCIVSLLSTLWEMLQFVTRVSFKDLQLYERLGLLRTRVKRQSDRFDDEKMLDITVATVSDAAVRIFSLFQKDVVADQGLQCFLDDGEVIWAEFFDEKVVEINFSQTNILGFLDFLLEDYLREVKSSEVDLNTLSCMPKIKEHLVFLKYFMGKFVELRNQQEKLHQDVWNLAVQIAYKIEFLIDQLVLGDVLDSFSISLRFITLDIMFLKKADSLNIFNDEGRQEIFEVQQITYPSADKVLSISSRPLADEVVGFEKENASIINQLVTGFKKLQTVAIIGMPGLGKTTLATKVYSSSSISLYFHVKARCSISQVFDRRKVLLELINQIQPEKSVSTMNEDDLSRQLWRSLKRLKYLIFIDDIWDTKAFDLLKESLPDDLNQSRILLTSRHDDIVPRDVIYDKPFFLRHLNLDESLELLQRKLFPTQKDWPLELHEFGVEIAEYCKGLALTVVIIAGILKTTEQEGWKNVLKMLRSNIISDVTDQCGSTIELSYKHLPNHLKACFLWFGAFPKGSELSVKRMIFLWISEGFVRKNESMSLEDVGRDCINNLISRSLVMSAEKSSGGGVKTFRIHDLLHDFCMRKANEEYFLHFVDELETTLIAETENSCSVESRNVRRLCIYSKPSHLKWKVFCPRLRSLVFFHSMEWSQELDLSYIFRMFKLLRVLSIGSVKLTGFPSEISALVQLRYLEIQVRVYVGPEIGNLSKLEILILCSASGSLVLYLPATLWNLQKLRHLYHNAGSIELPIDDSNDSCNLLELQTLTTLCVTDSSVLEKQLRKFPNLRRMKCKVVNCSLRKDGSVDHSMLIGLSFPSQLESLSLNRIRCPCPSPAWTPSPELAYPESIKKLTLVGTKYPWHKIASIAKLPHLEVLKLLKSSFVGDTWHVEEGDFPGLKFLKFQSLNLVKWTAASADLFSNLEKLVLKNCGDLEEVPEFLHYAANLDTIEVINCGDRVVSLLKSVKESQNEMGNSSLHFHQQQQNWQSSLDDDTCEVMNRSPTIDRLGQ